MVSLLPAFQPFDCLESWPRMPFSHCYCLKSKIYIGEVPYLVTLKVYVLHTVEHSCKHTYFYCFENSAENTVCCKKNGSHIKYM